MLTRHRGLLIFLLLAVAGHAGLNDYFFGREPPWFQVGFAILLAPILLVFLGEWVADDATTSRWRRRGFAISAVGAIWHLLLDAGCLLLPWLGGPWRFALAGAAAGAILMGFILRRSLRGYRDPDAAEPNPALIPDGETPLARLGRELSLLGGTPLTVTLVGAAFVAAALFGMARHPERIDLKILGAAAFFALCGAVGVGMALDRRAMLLGQPSPLRHLRLRFRHSGRAIASRDGLLLVDRKGATLYRWAAMVEVAVGSVHNNSAVLVRLLQDAPAERLAAPDGQPADDSDGAWAKREARNRKLQLFLCGYEVAVFGTLTDEGPGVLAQQLATGLDDPAARRELPAVGEFLIQHFLGRA